MTTTLADATRNVMVAAAAGQVDEGDSNPSGVLRIYSGAKPESAQDEATGVLLAEVTLDEPAFGEPNVGTVALQGTPIEVVGVADGTAGWARVLNRDRETVLDWSVSNTSGNGDVKMNTTVVSTGVAVTITAGSITQPSGAEPAE